MDQIVSSLSPLPKERRHPMCEVLIAHVANPAGRSRTRAWTEFATADGPKDVVEREIAQRAEQRAKEI